MGASVVYTSNPGEFWGTVRLTRTDGSSFTYLAADRALGREAADLAAAGGYSDAALAAAGFCPTKKTS